MRDLSLPKTRARVRYSKGSKRRAAVLSQFLRELTESTQLPERFYELLVLSRSDWHDRLSAPYGPPLTRVQHGKLRVIAAADYPERLVKSLDGLRLRAAQQGYQTPSTWPEFFDVLIGIAWGSTACVHLGLATRVFWLDKLTATAFFARAYCYPRRQLKQSRRQRLASEEARGHQCTTNNRVDSSRESQVGAWFAVCAAAGNMVKHTRAPHGLRPTLILQGHVGLAALALTEDDTAWHTWQSLLKDLPKSHGKADMTQGHIRLREFMNAYPKIFTLNDFIKAGDDD
ncbi:MAG: hypothetical protein AAF267_14995 [Deinococcota bacterium]